MTEHPSNINDTGDLNGQRESPLVSVIIPTYNRAKYVTLAIDSVLAQTYTDYEIIVVDDGSTDNTREVLSPYMHRIKYIYQDNAGAYSARNLGIREAKGEWIALLDSDDRWLSEKLARQMECVYRTGIKACFTNSEFFDGEKLVERYPTKYKKTVNKEEVITDPFALFTIDGPPLSIVTMLAAKDLLEKVGRFDEKFRIGDDTRLIFSLALETPFVFIYSVQVIINRTKDRGGLVNNSLMTIRERIPIQISILSKAYFHKRQKSQAAISGIRRRLGYALSRRAEIACIDKQYGNAKRFAKDALYFGNDLKTYMRSLAIWLWPQFAAHIYKSRWNRAGRF